MPSRSWFLAGAALASLAAAPRVHALAFDVPLTHATLQAAVAAAAISPDVDNVITLSASPLVTNASVVIGAAFGPTRQLLIRPADALSRASLVNTFPSSPILDLSGAGNVTVQDLDVLRNVTNAYHLVRLDNATDIVIERCRIGSNWTTGGAAGWDAVFMTYPTNVLLRNNVVFALLPGTFDIGIDATSFNDPANSLRLYNNLVTDYRVHGIRVESAIAGPLILLRNNIVVNDPALVPEPVPFRTDVLAAGGTVVSSHNATLSNAGSELVPFGNQPILGSSPQALPKAAAAVTFSTMAWAMGPPFDVNPNLGRLLAAGGLHTSAAQYGVTVTTGGADIAVVDDIEQSIRPGGSTPHTVRGPFQLDPGTALAVGPGPGPGGLLTATLLANPGRALALAFEAGERGRVDWTVFDTAGRLLHREARWATAGGRGELRLPPGRLPPGIVFVRGVLAGSAGGNPQVVRRAVVLP